MYRAKIARVAVVQPPADAEGSSGEEDEGEGEEEGVEDSQILEDLPDETEVRNHVAHESRQSPLIYV